MQEKGCFDRLRGLLAKIGLEYIDVIVCVLGGGGSERRIEMGGSERGRERGFAGSVMKYVSNMILKEIN